MKNNKFTTISAIHPEISDNAALLAICNYNIRSFNSNHEIFLAFLHSLNINFNVIILTETRFLGEQGADVGGYNGYHCGRALGGGGGVSVYCDSELSSRKLNQLCMVDENVECCVIEIVCGKRPLIIVAIYRPPTGSLVHFGDFICSILNHPLLLKKEVVLTGDINVDLLDFDSSCLGARNFVHNMYSLNFLAVVTKPTRFPSGNQLGQPSLLDHIWYNRCNNYDSGIFLFGHTDHLPTFLIIKDFSTPLEGLTRIEFRDHSRLNVEKFVNVCRNVIWDQFGGDVNSDTLFFIETLDDIYKRCFPLKIKYVSNKRISKPWLTSEILKNIKLKSAYFKKLKLNLISDVFYKIFKNRLVNQVRRAKKNYCCSAFKKCKNDLKSTWNLIKSLVLNNKSEKSVRFLLINNNEITDHKLIAEHFNDYFCGIADELNSNIPPSISDPVSNISFASLGSLFLSPVSCNEIVAVTNKLKNSSYGLYNVPTKFFKMVIVYLAKPLSVIVNNSFVCGVFPNCLKKAIVIPVYKSGSESEVSNFRPISLLPLLSKIFEKCVASRLTGYLCKNNILNSQQFGFQKGRSTSDGILNFVEKVYSELNDRKSVFGVSIDFRKAFDTVCHDVLLRKLERYGVRGCVLSWFRSYLHGRTQSVRIGSMLSAPRVVSCGVPQGSVLGPTLFILYVNDIVNVSNDAHFTLFADDTTLAFSDRDYTSLIERTNLNLSRLYDWTVNNRLSLNTNKTSAMLISNLVSANESALSLAINGVSIDFENSIKFLGVSLDDRLNFSYHIQNMCNKISKTCGILYRASDCIPQNILINLYYSLVYPHLLYGILIWGDAADSHMSCIILIQKRLIRILTSSDYLAPTSPLFLLTKILPIRYVYKFAVGIFMYGQHMSNSILYPSHDHDTRSRTDATLTFQRLGQCQRSLSFNGPKIWNSIPLSIRNSSSLLTFKKKYKHHLLEILVYDGVG